jgi:hypothetical protein
MGKFWCRFSCKLSKNRVDWLIAEVESWLKVKSWSLATSSSELFCCWKAQKLAEGWQAGSYEGPFGGAFVSRKGSKNGSGVVGAGPGCVDKNKCLCCFFLMLWWRDEKEEGREVAGGRRGNLYLSSCQKVQH